MKSCTRMSTRSLSQGARVRFACGVVLAMITMAQSSATAQNAISPAQLESMIFQHYSSPNVVRERWMFSLDRRIRRINHSIPLSDAQQQKLRLAGQGDIQRFFNRVVAARQKFQTLAPDEADFAGAYEIAEPLQLELAAGPFGNRSLFAKVLETTLDESQLEVHHELESLRRQQENEATVRLYISSTLEANLPVTANQREALVKLLASRHSDMPQGTPFRLQWIGYRLTNIPEEELAGIFDAEQIAAVRKIKAQLAGHEQFLQQQGGLDDAAE